MIPPAVRVYLLLRRPLLGLQVALSSLERRMAEHQEAHERVSRLPSQGWYRQALAARLRALERAIDLVDEAARDVVEAIEQNKTWRG
jgi:hypothetical protein